MPVATAASPWYKHLWPWIIIGILACSVTLTLSMVTIAVNNPDNLVNDNYYEAGKGINRSLDRELLASVYWPDGTDDHGAFVGSAPDYVDWVMTLLSGWISVHHDNTNILIDIDGDTLRVGTAVPDMRLAKAAAEASLDEGGGGDAQGEADQGGDGLDHAEHQARAQGLRQGGAVLGPAADGGGEGVGGHAERQDGDGDGRHGYRTQPGA